MNKEKILYIFPLINLIIFIMFVNMKNYSDSIDDLMTSIVIYSFFIIFVILYTFCCVDKKVFKLKYYSINWIFGTLIGFLYGLFFYSSKNGIIGSTDLFLFFSGGIVYYHIPILIVLVLTVFRRKQIKEEE